MAALATLRRAANRACAQIERRWSLRFSPAFRWPVFAPEGLEKRLLFDRSIAGNVYLDTNNNGVYDGPTVDVPITNATVTWGEQSIGTGPDGSKSQEFVAERLEVGPLGGRRGVPAADEVFDGRFDLGCGGGVRHFGEGYEYPRRADSQ